MSEIHPSRDTAHDRPPACREPDLGRDCRGVLLDPEEAVVAVRSEASVDVTDGRDPINAAVWGALYVTTRRLIHVAGKDVMTIELDDIDDATMVLDRLLFALKSGRGVAIESRLLRQLHATVIALRAERQVKAR